MSSISLGEGNCAECRKGPLSRGIPVYSRPMRKGGGGHDIEIWCIDCVRRLLHHEGEDEVSIGG